LIRAVHAAAPKEFIAILTITELIREDDLELENLTEVIGKMWRHIGGNPDKKL